MFSNIHNSPKTNKHAPKAGLPAFMGAVIIAMVAGSAPAYAHCERHVYNNSSEVWKFEIFNQPSNNPVEYTLQPGQSRSYWIVTDGANRMVQAYRYPPEAGWYLDRGPTAYVDGCYFRHELSNYPFVTWNEPANGDVTIHDCIPNPRYSCAVD